MDADFDAVVVGAGAGGGVAAYVLASRGWKVALVEKGRNPYPSLGAPTLRGSLLGNDEIRRRRYYGFHDPLVEPRTFRGAPGAAPAVREFQGLGVCVGGGTVFYDGDSPRFERADFRRLSTFGPVAGADVADWPLAYDDLAPYYDAVERLIGVQGRAGADPFAEPRDAYPMPPGYPSKAGLVLSGGAGSLGYHPHPMPMAINSTFYRGRPACTNCGFCPMGCPVNAKGSTAVTAIRDALLGGNLQLVAESCVTAVEIEPSGERATGVRLIGPSGEERTLSARHVVLGANAIETPRLLLASQSAAHPEGLGNGSGLLGRYLMFHIVVLAVGVFDEEIRSYRGRVITHAMADFTVDDGSAEFVRGGYVELGGSIHPVAEGLAYPWQLHRELMVGVSYRRHVASVGMIGEDMPVPDNRVELDPDVRDVYGRPVARVTFARHPYDQAMVERYLPKLEEIARAAGAASVLRIDKAKQAGAPDTKHLLGTARMGADPARSVVDHRGRLHEVDNVWIVDGSVFPTSGAFNPTLTEQALAWRTAAYVAAPEDPRP